MKHAVASLLSLLAISVAAFAVTAGDTDRITAEGGNIAITPITLGSVQVEFQGKVIQIDPWSRGDVH